MLGKTKWMPFKVGSLFDIHPTKNLGLNNNKLFEMKGSTPVVVNSSYHNGIGGYVNLPATEKGGIITFSDTTSSDAIFYQPEAFIGYSHVQGMYPKDFEWSEKSLLFFLTIFKKAAILKNFDYTNKFSRKIAEEMVIKLPIDDHKKLNFKYMEEYMDQYKLYVDKKISNLKKIKNYHSDPLDIKHWKAFHLYDIFYIEGGSNLDKAKMKQTNPTINFVGRTGINNGVTIVVDKIKGKEPFKAGNLTLSLGGAYIGSCFVQDKEFYTSQNVVVLKPKKNMNIYIKQFLCSVIFKEGNTNYQAFVNELNKHIKTDFKIVLPVDSKGELNFKYMENYIKKLPFGIRI